jgi:hypothetical protein
MSDSLRVSRKPWRTETWRWQANICEWWQRRYWFLGSPSKLEPTFPDFYSVFNLWQIAKAYGAYVVTTCSPDSQAFVKSLGPDATIDYRSYLASTYSAFKFDLIFDTVGTDISALYAASPAYLQPEGIFLDVAGAVHIMDNVKSALTTVVGIINGTVRPTFLGGTPRKYLPITFWATSMVCSTVLHSVTGSFLYADQRVERMC